MKFIQSGKIPRKTLLSNVISILRAAHLFGEKAQQIKTDTVTETKQNPSRF